MATRHDDDRSRRRPVTTSTGHDDVRSVATRGGGRPAYGERMDRTQDWGQDRDELRLHGHVDGRSDPVGHPDHVQEQARAMLATAIAEARTGLAEGGIPIGAALYGPDGALLGRGHNRRVQDDDPTMHAETAAFRAAGRQRTYRGTTMVTTLSPAGIAAAWSASSASRGS